MQRQLVTSLDDSTVCLLLEEGVLISSGESSKPSSEVAFDPGLPLLSATAADEVRSGSWCPASCKLSFCMYIYAGTVYAIYAWWVSRQLRGNQTYWGIRQEAANPLQTNVYIWNLATA